MRRTARGCLLLSTAVSSDVLTSVSRSQHGSAKAGSASLSDRTIAQGAGGDKLVAAAGAGGDSLYSWVAVLTVLAAVVAVSAVVIADSTK